MAALEALKNAKVREAIERAQRAVPTAPETPVSLPTPKISSNPPAQLTSTASVTNVPPATFRAQQAAKAEKVMDALQTTNAEHNNKDCPNCTASVPIATTRCRCGFAFVAGGNDMPTLTLCTGDFTALRNSLNLHLRRNN